MKKEIGLRFRAFRKFIQKNHKELAEELRVSQSTISNIESGSIFPQIHYQYYLNRKYNLNINWLLSGSEEMIIPSVKASKTAASFKLDDSAAVVDTYEEFYTLMCIPVIERAILSKLDELKVLFKDEIKTFFKEHGLNKNNIDEETLKICEEIIMQVFECDLKILRELNCKTLAIIYGINRSYLSRIFKKYQGVYLGKSIKLIRILRSAFFMAENRDLTVTEISDIFGFQRADYFIKKFKKIFGMTPGEFKRCTC